MGNHFCTTCQTQTNTRSTSTHFIAICSVAPTPVSTCLVLAGLAEVLRLHRPLGLHELSISGLGSTTILGLGLGYTVKVHTKFLAMLAE